MKTLITLMVLMTLIVSTAVGQERCHKKAYLASRDGLCTIGQIVVLEDLLENWDSYKAKCWADSNRHSCDMIYNEGVSYVPRTDSAGFFKIYSAGTTGVEVWWEHREPTFDGFMEYLRKETRQ